MLKKKKAQEPWWKVYIGGHDFTLVVWGVAFIFVISIAHWFVYTDTFFLLETISPIVAMYLPLVVFGAHARKQDRLLDKIRVRYVMAEGLFLQGNEKGARKHLNTIHSLERRWHFGSGWLSKISLTAVASLVCVPLWIVFFFLNQHSSYGYKVLHENIGQAILKYSEDWSLLAFVTGMSVLLNFLFLGNGKLIEQKPWSDFYGDRLQQMLNAGRNVSVQPDHLSRHGTQNISQREMFGLAPHFTSLELRNAWKRLVRELHPDLWVFASAEVRKHKEEALKYVNAAYDSLKRELS